MNWNVLIEQLPPISSLRYDEFIKKIVHLFQSSCPHKNVASKPRTKWITAKICASQEFLQLISMYVERNPENTELLTYYMQHKTRHMGMLRKARKEFINNTIALSDNTSRALWNVIRSETNKGSSGGGELVLLRTAMCGPGAAPRQLAEQLNQYYLAVVRDTPLRPDIPAASLFLRERVPTTENTMFLRPFTVDELNKIIQSIKKKRTKDINDMPTDLLHKLPVQLLHIMCDLFNDCILDGQYPDSMKIVKISPVYKGSGSKTDHKKYRPIAIVPAVSKAFEMGLCNRLNSFMAHHELFCSSQHAYQPGRSTRGAARRLLRAVSAQLEAGRRVAAVFLDLSRAFDLVDHQLIIAKLAHYGVRGTAQNCIRSFLSDRVQITVVGNEQSSPGKIGDRSVPQGSNVGNSLFLIMMNDLPHVTREAEFIMYADDICAIVSAETAVQLVHNLMHTIESLVNWFTINGMQVNIDKTKLLYFSLRNITTELPTVTVHNTTVPYDRSAKFVGFTFDTGLQWHDQIEDVCAKLNSAFFAISRLAPTLSRSNVITAYHAYFQSILIYGIEFWGLAADWHRPFVLQKRMIRRIMRKPPDEPARELFIELGVLTVPSLFILEVAKYVRLNLSEFTFTSKISGELASCVHRFVRHGDERVATLARRLLTALTYPLLLMLTRWLMHGEIEDPFNEFFIESRSGVPIDRMWHDKYRVREWMVPSFMSREQASQILATGKSVVFMREACAHEPAPAAHAQSLTLLLQPPTATLEVSTLVHSCYKSVVFMREACAHEPAPAAHAQSLTLLLQPPSGTEAEQEGSAWWEAPELRDAVASAHTAASQRLLTALTTHHHLLDHLVAHRRYLLLAQGDFVHHLMTLMQDELNKPASSLYVHNLSCTLEAAVRATNAQFEPPHVLSRLHVNLYPNCDGRIQEDSGWDVFALQYRVDGPLGTLFPAACAARYRLLFTQLWRVKRLEHALHDAWRRHAILNKRLKYMPEVWGLMRRVSCLRAEALRLCSALQEAGAARAEPAWAELLAGPRPHLDALLELHLAALERQCIDAMIHHTTQELQSYLGNVLNETLALRSFETTLHAGITAELDRRQAIEEMKGERVARGEEGRGGGVGERLEVQETADI
ncbi:unnamed protein product [Plutella xylostella]|uniref:(diamondback moth) hypothetical protein n=1 Tax=Plutella xylostella TaxID=51655 RepID=A0A8S4E1I3_PLUXY|nr:unnamed protein product [Plutella xylostella]